MIYCLSDIIEVGVNELLNLPFGGMVRRIYEPCEIKYRKTPPVMLVGYPAGKSE
jgi:hypothetical protein